MKRNLLLILFFITISGVAQNSSAGTEFWMGFFRSGDTIFNKADMKLFISSAYDANVIVSIPKQSFADTIFVPKDSVRIYTMPRNKVFNPFYDQVANKGVHITSDLPVSVSASNQYLAGSEATIVLPLANIPQQPLYVSGNADMRGGAQLAILLVGCEDSTIIKVTPPAATFRNKLPFYVVLDAGQVYQVVSSNELNATHIEVLNNKKLVVFTGALTSEWPCGGSYTSQNEQVVPVIALDTAYCLPMQFGHTKGYYIKLIPPDTSRISIKVNDTIYKNISRINPLTLSMGEAAYVSSKKPFYCYQFLKGSTCSGYNNIATDYGDPTLTSVVSNKHMGKSALFSTVHSNSINLRDHFVSIVIKTSERNKVYLDKTKIDSTEFNEFRTAKAYSFAMIKISKGQHLVECDKGLLAYSYGVGFRESYFYMAGFSLPVYETGFKDSAVTYDCKNKKIELLFRSEATAALKYYNWTFGDGQSATGNPVKHTFQKAGLYTVKLVSETMTGRKDSSTRKIRVEWPDFDPIRDKTLCGNESVTFEETNPYFKNFKWQDSSTKNFLKTSTKVKVWVRATDQSGYCKFVDSGTISKIEVSAKIFVDSMEACWRFNKFNFKDSTKVTGDSLLYNSWVFPWTSYWDTTDVTVRFPTPGNFKVFYDVYTVANCKARFVIPVKVHPMPKAFNNLSLQDFCSNKPFFITDKSKIATGSIKKVKWLFDDKTSIVSDSLKAYATLQYDKNKQDVMRFVQHIAFSNFNCTDTFRSPVLVWPKPEVNFSLISPDTIKCLSGARWTFTSLTRVDNDTFSLSWNSGNGKLGKDYSLKNVRYFNPGKYKVILKALSPFGCHDSISKTIEVIPDLKARFVINDSAQCRLNNLFRFRDTSNTKNLSYVWTLGNGNTSTNAVVDSVQYTSVGLKAVKLKISIPLEGCVDSITKIVNVLNEPKAVILSNKDTQCFNGANVFSLSNQSVFYQPYQSSEWTSGANRDTGFNLFLLSVKDTGNHLFRLVVHDKEGCSDTVFRSIRIEPHPTANMFLNDSIQCFMNNAFIFSTVNKNDVTHTWKINNKPVGSAIKDSLIYKENVPGLHQVKILSINKAGCMDSIAKMFRLLDAPKAGFNINNDSQCLNTNRFSFTDASVAVNDKINEWIYYANNGTHSGNPGLADIIYNSDGEKTIRYLIKTTEGCTDSIQKSIFIFSDIAGYIMGDSVCLKEEAIIKFIQTGGNPATTWNWNLGDGNTANTAQVNHVYANAGYYNNTLQVSDIYGCKTQLTLPDAVHVYQLPDASFTYAEKPYAININKLVFLPNLKNASYYLWRFPGGSTNDNDTAEFLIKKLYSGLVSLTVTNEHGCRDSSFREIDVYPENYNAFIPNAISANGDGMNDIFKVEGLENASNFNLRIMNRWGEQLFYSTDITTGWDGTYQGDYVPVGLYTYSVKFTYLDNKTYEIVGMINVLR